MIKNYNGDLLKSGCKVIAHQTNTAGVMGAGIALQVRKQFPEVYRQYRNYCLEDFAKIGTVLFLKDASDVWVANCFSQNEWRTDEAAVKSVALALKSFCTDNDIHTLGIPYLYGCGIAGGDWTSVSKIFDDVFKDDESVELQIWKYNPDF